MNILFIGDVVGKPGRDVVRYYLDNHLENDDIDFVIANLENATHGKGLIRSHFIEMVESGVDVATLGNHYFAKKEIFSFIEDYDNLLRPANLHKSIPGIGTNVYKVGDITVRVTNLMGRVFMDGNLNNPFDILESIINEDKSDFHFVDFHAEATGEKQSLAYAFDGKVGAVIGTHTHVQTNDLHRLPNGTIYMSDVGMCGPLNGILGTKKEEVINRSWKGIPGAFEVFDDDDEYVFSALVINFDEFKKKVVDYKNIYKVFTKDEVDTWLKTL